MIFDEPLTEGVLERRYKRFLADVRLTSGERLTAHCPNTGSLLGCIEPGFRVWLSHSSKPGRKYPHTWELVEVRGGVTVGINTGRSNALVGEALCAGRIESLRGYQHIRREVRFGEENSRVDLLLEDGGEMPSCYVEVKNVTAAVDDGVAVFPDAVSARGTRHLRELVRVVEAGHRAAICFCVQRGDVTEVRPADDIDPGYGTALREAVAAGVEAIAYRADVSPKKIELVEQIPVVCP
ncbi:MAG: DNA/RNA nuclease SfsA [Gammaproteobacteria bacterium]|nr:DNA/RNA nuclease SfsA [Gammaproteobacteria bacterium]